MGKRGTVGETGQKKEGIDVLISVVDCKYLPSLAVEPTPMSELDVQQLKKILLGEKWSSVRLFFEENLVILKDSTAEELIQSAPPAHRALVALFVKSYLQPYIKKSKANLWINQPMNGSFLQYRRVIENLKGPGNFLIAYFILTRNHQEDAEALGPLPLVWISIPCDADPNNGIVPLLCNFLSFKLL